MDRASLAVTLAILFLNVSVITARPQGPQEPQVQQQKAPRTANDPYPKDLQCAHPRLLAGIEAASKDLPDISVFAAAAKASGLMDHVFAYHRYTILAPTNQAFEEFAASLGLTSASQLLTDEHQQLLIKAVRLHFGVGGAHYTQHLQEGSTTVGVFAPGESLQASTTDGQVTFMGPVNQAVVVTQDVPLCNSVMHVVDAVLVPAAEQAAAAKRSEKTIAGTAEL